MRAALWTLSLTLLPAFAGCLEDTDLQGPGVQLPVPEPRLVCLEEASGPRCNLEATISPETRQANELSISVNPKNPLNVIATGKDYTPEEAGDCVWAGLYTTVDGGKTWKNQNVPGSPWRALADPTAPKNDFTKFWCATDPVVAFGPDGTAYWTVMPYQCDRASGSKTGRGVVPMGGFNDWLFTCSAMFVLVSTDGGLTWPTWRQVAVGPLLEHDKQWIATAPNGNVLLCWDRADYTEGATPLPTEMATGGSAIWCSVSTDKGQTWSDNTPLNSDWPGALPAVDYGPDNTAYATYLDGERILVSSSADGLRWSPPVAVGGYEDPPRGGEYNWPVLRGSDFRTFAVPLIAVDRSDGPFRGSVYVTWFDHSQGEGNVLVASSRDGGKTWSEPAKPHDDVPAAKADQFFPAISVGPDGAVDVSWYDRRDDAQNHLFHLYFASSRDGGVTWSRNLRVTDLASDEQYSHHQNGMVFLGDYRDQESSAAGAHLVWVDTRNHKADVFTATVAR